MEFYLGLEGALVRLRKSVGLPMAEVLAVLYAEAYARRKTGLTVLGRTAFRTGSAVLSRALWVGMALQRQVEIHVSFTQSLSLVEAEQLDRLAQFTVSNGQKI